MKQAGEVLEVKIADLIPFPRNYRHHPPAQLERIAASLKQHGQYRGIVVQKSTNYILAGHGVVEAARSLGAETVLAQVLDIGPEESQQVLIEDNALAQHAEDDPEQLLELLADLVNTEYQPASHNTEEIEALLASVTLPRLEDPGPGEPPEEALTQPGDLWLLGKHKVLCGDCADALNWERLLGKEKAALGLTDPPYNVGYDYADTQDEREADDYAAWCRDWFTLLRLVSERQIVTPGYVNEGLWYALAEPYHIAPWTKTNAMTNGKVARFFCWEPILFYGEHWGRTRANDVFDYPVSKQEGVGSHTCPKPLGLWDDLLSSYTAPGDLVVDCFVGSGTTVVSAEHLGRRACGMDISPAYVDVTLRRWQQMTGEHALLESTGEPFPG